VRQLKREFAMQRLIRGSFLELTVMLAVLAVGLSAAQSTSADDWPQWRGPQRDGVWRETGVVEKFDQPELKSLWRAPISAGYCGPTVAEGRVYVMDRVSTPADGERVLCFRADSGEPLWNYFYECRYERVAYASGPRASVSVDGGRAYALGTMGNFHCLDAATGKVLWSKDLKAAYRIRMPQWGIAAAPLLEGKLVIVQIGGADGACLVAFDKQNGEKKWKAFDDVASYSAPIAIDQAGRRVIVCVTGAHVVGLDARSGKLYWEHPFPPSHMPIAVATPVIGNDCLFVSSAYDGALMLKLDRDKPAVTQLWRRKGKSERATDALHCLISTPLIDGANLYGLDMGGVLRCLDVHTGDRVWENKTASDRKSVV
jgi:outer membrane protein assembly factor BamB